MAFFPDATNSSFLLNEDVGILVNDLVAMGSPAVIPPAKMLLSSHSGHSMVDPPASNTILPQQTQFTPTARKNISSNVKVVQASIRYLSNGKVEFSAMSQTHVDVTDATANVNFVNSAVQRKWGPEFVIVTSDGLKLEDSSGTQGKRLSIDH